VLIVSSDRRTPTKSPRAVLVSARSSPAKRVEPAQHPEEPDAKRQR
jgi:hypothetical protein